MYLCCLYRSSTVRAIPNKSTHPHLRVKPKVCHVQIGTFFPRKKVCAMCYMCVCVCLVRQSTFDNHLRGKFRSTTLDKSEPVNIASEYVESIMEHRIFIDMLVQLYYKQHFLLPKYPIDSHNQGLFFFFSNCAQTVQLYLVNVLRFWFGWLWLLTAAFTRSNQNRIASIER